MMERALVGCDILASGDPPYRFDAVGRSSHNNLRRQCDIYAALWAASGWQIKLWGSIDLLRDMALLEGSQITAKALEGRGESEKDTWRFVPHVSFDLVIMNPPFTRATNHEAGMKMCRIPMFAAFGSSAEEQKAMSNMRQQKRV